MTGLSTPRAAFLILAALACACAPTEDVDVERADSDVPDWVGNGRLVIIGGALAAGNEAVYREVVDGREGDGPLCVIPTASGDPESSMATAVSRLGAWAGNVPVEGILITTDAPERASDPEVAESVRGCSGYFFTGGSQSRVMDVFRPGDGTTPAYEALMERWREGAVVAGTSAGAAMMSTVSVAGGSSLSALEHGVRSSEEEGGLWVRRGMELVPWAVVDQHFLARGRWARMVVATLAHPQPGVGVGVDENTALVVDGGVGRVVGASGVVWLDSRGDAGGEPDGTRQATLTLLGRGDRVHILDGSIERAGSPVDTPATVRMAPAGEAGDADHPLLERWALLHALDRMRADSEALELTAGQWSLSLIPGPGFQRLGDGGEGVEGATGGLSVGPMTLRARRSAPTQDP